jgi:hypothetical protein
VSVPSFLIGQSDERLRLMVANRADVNGRKMFAGDGRTRREPVAVFHASVLFVGIVDVDHGLPRSLPTA